MRITRDLPGDGSLRKRRIYLVLLLLGALGAAISFAQNALSPYGTPSIAGAAVAIFGACLALAGLTRWRRIDTDRLERILIAAATLVLAGAIAFGLYATPDGGPQAQNVAAMMLWVPLLFVFCAIAFDGATSLRYSLAIYVLLVALTLPHAFATMSGTGLVDGLHFLLQAYLAYAVTIVALYFFSDIEQRAFTMEETARTMRRLANTDALTALANRRQCEEQLASELRRAERYSRVFSVLMIDIDGFKELNDRFGHLAGDDVLVDMARRIERMVRASDLIARWGGEEFLLLAPETGLEDARRLAEMTRHHIDTNVLAERHHVTISVGVASYRGGDTVQSVVARADAALYLAKRGGRNQVKVEIVPAPTA
jgi:diguanylate cyclase